MGFDLYGLNPTENTEGPPILSKFKDNDGWNNWEEMTKKDKDAYFKADSTHQEENPGIYFRANVWWWRPIWIFVCYSCDFLSAKDCEKGDHNGGETISKTKSLRIASRLRKLDRTGVIDAWVNEYMKEYEKAKKHNKTVQKQLDKLQNEVKDKFGNDIVPSEYPEPYKTQWDTIYHEGMNWNASYPTSKDIIMRFASFCEQSGGFEIC